MPLSRVSAYDWFGSFAFAPIGFAIWGPIADAVGTSEALWISGAISVASTAAAAVRARRPPRASRVS